MSLHRIVNIRSASIEGGKKDDAIPREAHAVLAVKNGDVAAASAKVKALQRRSTAKNIVIQMQRLQ